MERVAGEQQSLPRGLPGSEPEAPLPLFVGPLTLEGSRGTDFGGPPTNRAQSSGESGSVINIKQLYIKQRYTLYMCALCWLEVHAQRRH